jgi:hypothetical protein
VKVEILDRDVFSSLKPNAISNYLRVNGWSEIRRVDGELTIFGKANRENNNQLIWMPVSDQFSDYIPMVSRLIKTVANTEDKSELQIIDDLQTVAIGDVIHVRTFNPLDIHDHTIPLVDGVSLLSRSRMIAMAAAASAVRRRPIHPRRPFFRVSQFIQNLRLGQTERGSYMIRLIAPIEEIPKREDGELNGMPEEIPFTRRAVMELVKSLNALKEAAEDNRDRGRFLFNTFRDVVPLGVSANLCEALIDDEEKESNPIELSVTWSYVLKLSEYLSTAPIRFDSTIFPYLRQAAKEFRARNPEIVTIEGVIYILEREKDSRFGSGSIRIFGRADGRSRSVRVILDAETYDKAIDAHKKGDSVSVTGKLIVEGDQYRLEDPANFHIVEQLRFL